jgi:hypothetical protein
MRAKAVAVAFAVAVAATSCGRGGSLSLASTPLCEDVGSVVLVAQSVPTGSRVACIARLFAGWDVTHVDATEDGTVIRVASDLGGPEALALTYRDTCPESDLTDADGEGHLSFARTAKVPGACILLEVDLRGEANLKALAAQALSTVGSLSRDEIARWVEDTSDGRLHLDP